MSDIFAGYIDDMRRRGKLGELARAARCAEAAIRAARLDPNRIGRDAARRIHGYMRRTGAVDKRIRFVEIFPKFAPKGAVQARVPRLSYAEHLVREVEAGRTTSLILKDIYGRASPASRIQLGRALEALGVAV